MSEANQHTEYTEPNEVNRSAAGRRPPQGKWPKAARRASAAPSTRMGGKGERAEAGPFFAIHPSLYPFFAKATKGWLSYGGLASFEGQDGILEALILDGEVILGT